MQLPGDHDVARRVSDAHRLPVDHASDPPVTNQPVAGVEVAVVPDRRTFPRRGRKCPVPGGPSGGAIAVKPRQSPTRLWIAVG